MALNVASSSAVPLANQARVHWFREVFRPDPTPMPFEWALVGLLVIGFGALGAVV